MKEAFEAGQYQKLKDLVDKAGAGSRDAAFYKGLMLENGLAQEVNLEEAVRYYKDAFDEGKESLSPNILRAGIALARVYRKTGDREEAKEIYKLISKASSSYNDQTSINYAKYQLARFAAKDLIETKAFNDKNIESAEIVINAYTEFLEYLDQNSPLATKVLYHQALMELKLAETAQAKLRIALEKKNQAELAELKAKTPGENISGLVATKKLELEEKTKKLLAKSPELEIAKASFEAAKAKGYSPAKAELLNIEAKALFEEKKYDKAITKFN